MHKILWNGDDNNIYMYVIHVNMLEMILEKQISKNQFQMPTSKLAQHKKCIIF